MENYSAENILMNISSDMLQMFLKSKKIWWSHLMKHKEGYLCIPNSVSRIAESSNNQLDLMIKGRRDMFRVELTDSKFLIFDENDLVLDLTKDWVDFIARFEKGLDLIDEIFYI